MKDKNNKKLFSEVTFESIKLNCVLMENGELMFLGRSLGRISEWEIKKFVEKIR